MRAILRKELANYFKTPIAYIFIGMFTAISGLIYASVNIAAYASASVFLLLGSMRLPFLLMAPMLTMRLFAEEKRSRTDQLLFTSPLPLTAIAVGKYLAACAVLLVSLLLTLFYTMLASRVAQVYAGVVFANYFGFFLMCACTLAIGVWMSALCENQVSAGILSLGCNMLLYLTESYVVPQLGISYLATARSALNWLSLNARYETFSNGVISLSHVFYYLSFAGVMIYLAVRAIDRRRWAE
jgi:ABC-2 type transport system permease protein